MHEPVWDAGPVDPGGIHLRAGYGRYGDLGIPGPEPGRRRRGGKDAEEYRESLRNKTLPEGTTFAVQFDARATGTNETVDIEKIREINGQ